MYKSNKNSWVKKNWQSYTVVLLSVSVVMCLATRTEAASKSSLKKRIELDLGNIKWVREHHDTQGWILSASRSSIFQLCVDTLSKTVAKKNPANGEVLPLVTSQYLLFLAAKTRHIFPPCTHIQRRKKPSKHFLRELSIYSKTAVINQLHRNVHTHTQKKKKRCVAQSVSFDVNVATVQWSATAKVMTISPRYNQKENKTPGDRNTFTRTIQPKVHNAHRWKTVLRHYFLIQTTIKS